MSDSQALIAFPNTNSKDCFLKFWPHWQVLDQATFPDFDAAYQWSESRDAYINGSGNDRLVKLVFADGDWNVVVDFTMCMITDEDNLLRLSESVGMVLCELTQGTSGCVSFRKYRDGEVIRRIDYVDGDYDDFGDQQTEEQGVNISQFHDGELETLWRNHGLSGLLYDATISDLLALQIQDSAVSPELHDAQPPANRKKKWWQIW